MKAYREIYESVADNAAFFWVLRSIIVDRPDYWLDDLQAFDQRVVATFNALMTDPESSWELCSAAMSLQQSGEFFAAANIAFRSLDVKKIQEVVGHGLNSDEAFEGVAGALAWLPGRLCHSWIKKFLTSKDLNHKYLAITSCSLRREDPREYLTNIVSREDCCNHHKLHARALRLIGELKRRDLMFAVKAGLMSDNVDVRFWSIWSSLLLGDFVAAEQMKSFVFGDGPYAAYALDVTFRVLSMDNARDWISQMVKDPGQVRSAIQASAVLGDPQVIPWLISQMRVPALTRLAGEAFTAITGISLPDNKLSLEELPSLDGLIPDPDESEDDDVAIHEDEYLPFPDPDKIAAIWQRYQQHFISGKRYFMGQQINAEHLMATYSSGNQRQRRSAALELALLLPAHFLQNYAAKSVEEE